MKSTFETPVQDPTYRILCLIREELKAAKFFNTLTELGIQDCPYEPDFSEIILAEMGLDNGSDKIFALYHTLIAKHCNELEPNIDSFDAHALAVYVELVAEKKILAKQIAD